VPLPCSHGVGTCPISAHAPAGDGGEQLAVDGHTADGTTFSPPSWNRRASAPSLGWRCLEFSVALRQPRAQPLTLRRGGPRLLAQRGEVGAGLKAAGGSGIDDGEAQAIGVDLLAGG
jgi:hypothetical protein